MDSLGRFHRDSPIAAFGSFPFPLVLAKTNRKSHTPLTRRFLVCLGARAGHCGFDLGFTRVLRFLGFSLGVRIVYWRIGVALSVAALAWLMRRLLALIFERTRSSMWHRERSSTRSLVLLGERVFKVLIIVVAIFWILTIAGVDMTTALAGVGIGGVAIAFGAQKSVENLLGGIFLLTDKALAVGDMCRISNRLGVVEDITLRSVRLRTPEQTLLSIPAGVLSQANIENFATGTKIPAQTTLLLRYGTSAEQLRSALQGIHALLAGHPKLESETARIRLVDFGVHAIELELFAHVLTSDILEFLSVREDLLLQIAVIVESSGSGFAQPTQFIYREVNRALMDRCLIRPLPRKYNCRWQKPISLLPPTQLISPP